MGTLLAKFLLLKDTVQLRFEHEDRFLLTKDGSNIVLKKTGSSALLVLCVCRISFNLYDTFRYYLLYMHPLKEE